MTSFDKQPQPPPHTSPPNAVDPSAQYRQDLSQQSPNEQGTYPPYQQSQHQGQYQQDPNQQSQHQGQYQQHPNQYQGNYPSAHPGSPPPYPGYAPPGYPPYPLSVPTNSIGIAGFVCGLSSLVLFFVPFLGLALGIAGTALGGRGIWVSKQNGSGNGLSVAGLVCGIIGTLFGALYLIGLVTN